MILLWGLPGDTPMAQVLGALQRLSQPVVFFDQRDLPESELELRTTDRIDGTLSFGQQAIELDDIGSVYMRLYSIDQLPGLRGEERHSPLLAHVNAVVEALTSWTELAPILVVNRSSAMASNGSKPYQLRLIHEYGFEVPDTVITTDPSVACEFWEKHKTVIYKSMSGVRSIVAKLTPRHAERLALVRWCPTQFQQFVPGNDYRVHVVGDDVFTTEITSTADDYRYAHQLGTTAELRAYSLPADIIGRCRALTFSLGLEVAGVDLRRHPDGRWYCFEVNPSPAFSYFENATGQPIGMAVAQLLISGKSFTRSPQVP